MSAAFTEVVVTLPVQGRYHYRVPEHLAARARIGARVLVPFGRRKVTGVIVREDVTPPDEVTPVDLAEALDEEPALSTELLDLCLWIADYYEAPLGEVLKAALPAGSSVAASEVIVLSEAGRAAVDGDGVALPTKERALLAKVAGGRVRTTDLTKASRPSIDALVKRGLVEIGEHRSARARLRRERTARLLVPVDEARAMVARAPRRWAVVEALASGETLAVEAVAAQVPGAKETLRDLARAKLVELGTREAPLEVVAAGTELPAAEPPQLTAEQAHAVAELTAALANPSPTARAPDAAAETAPRDASAAAGGDSAERSSSAPSSAVASVFVETAGGVSAEVTSSAATSAVASVSAETPASGSAAETAPRDAAVASASAETPASGSAAETAPGDAAVASVSAETPASGSAAETAPADAAPPRFTPFLLHGVTGSGKTEVYLRVIAEALARGKTALVLVPEISLTPQLAARFRARFGDQVAILHSGLKDSARLNEWSRLRRGEARIAVGARSAVFAPIAGLGVIVVDEEHDGSFKQDEGVKYQARDVALVRAQRAGAVCVLGSATPSLETAAHAERGHYRKLVLTERPTSRPMPVVDIVDLRTYMPDGEAMLSAPLRAAITATLAAGDQVILFLNRRGFATFVLCRSCGHSFRCPNCSVSLTYHRRGDRLRCHYCDHREYVPTTCPKCNANDTIERKGLGTEKVADTLATEFPEASIARLDRDVASGAGVERILGRVARREVNLLVGTQMVTKGHDFPGVTLVGVLCADTGLDLPDFRASERTFQLLAQVAGRAGRGERAGRVIIQTYRPDSPAVVAAAAHDYMRFFQSELAARADIGYPPHGRLIAVRIDGTREHDVAATARKVAQAAEAVARRPDLPAPVEVLGPVPAPLERLRGRSRWQVWLRSRDRHALRRVARATSAIEVPSGVRVSLDVDPMSTM